MVFVIGLNLELLNMEVRSKFNLFHFEIVISCFIFFKFMMYINIYWFGNNLLIEMNFFFEEINFIILFFSFEDNLCKQCSIPIIDFFFSLIFLSKRRFFFQILELWKNIRNDLGFFLLEIDFKIYELDFDFII